MTPDERRARISLLVREQLGKPYRVALWAELERLGVVDFCSVLSLAESDAIDGTSGCADRASDEVQMMRTYREAVPLDEVFAEFDRLFPDQADPLLISNDHSEVVGVLRMPRATTRSTLIELSRWGDGVVISAIEESMTMCVDPDPHEPGHFITQHWSCSPDLA